MVSILLKRPRHKPSKPYADFPLFPHATRRWAKKIRGKLHYFGPWEDPDGALQRYLDQREALHAGRTPRTHSEGVTIRDAINHFLTCKKHLVETGEITQRTFRDYHDTCRRIATSFDPNRLVEDLAADDFGHLRRGIARTRGPVALGNEVQRVRVVFKYAYDAGLVEKPVRYGPTFKRPNRKVLRAARNANGARMFEADELRVILKHTEIPLHAMILLGINAGFGNADCGTLPIFALDLDAGWVNHPRPKTGIARRAPIWPETIAALRETIRVRPVPKDPEHNGLVFITKYGKPWAKETSASPITNECRKLLDVLGLYRRGLGFYALRHTFATIAGESRDQVAVDHIMGHARNDMASLYRERISDERLIAVTDYVRNWLFSDVPTVKRTQ